MNETCLPVSKIERSDKMETEKTLTIGKLARMAGIGIETIRFYEREGLIPDPPRRASGYRQYPEQSVRRVRFIRGAKDLGFSLKEIRELLSLRASPRACCADVRRRAESKVDNIDGKIQSLRAMRKALSTLIKQCSGHAPVSECPILESLDKMAVKS